MSRKVTDYLLYRWRYIVGYGVIGLIVASLIVVAGLLVPGGLSHDEMQSVITSSTPLTPLNPAFVTDLPYHLLQRASFHIFGVTILSVKLPSLILGTLSIIGIFVLLRGWFRHNVAILTTLVIITTGQFLYLTQSGTPGILHIFWSVWLLVAALRISRQSRIAWLWKIILAADIALSLYTLLSIYILIALTSAVIFHPHLRYIVRRLPKLKTTFAFIIGLLFLAPLIYVVWRHPHAGLALLGLPDSNFNIVDHLIQVARMYGDFWSPLRSPYLTPLYGAGTLALMLLGIMRLFTTKYTARSYIITSWSILLIPIIIINPDSASVTFVPALLLTAMGIASLLHMWYSIFPRNPYARIVGLVPLIILMGGILITSVDRYLYDYSYDPAIAHLFSRDLRLLNNQLPPRSMPATLVVSQDDLAFYQTVAKYHPGLTVATTQPATVPAELIISHTEHATTNTIPTRVVTDAMSDAADRFYIYKTAQK